MLYWEWRRILRQKIRNSVPRGRLTYQQYAKRRVLYTFVLFFIGWKAFAIVVNDTFLWTVDEETGEGRMLSPTEARQRREQSLRELDRRLEEKAVLPPFELDD